jgi:hypothetical protein
MKKYFGIAAMMMMMMLFASIAIAQHTSTQERTKGQSSTHVMVRSGKVIATEGNNLIIQMQDGKVEHLTVPADAKFTVDGKEVGITDLKPGTELSQSVITTTTPTTLRTTTTISGRVFAVNPPTSVILTLPGGENRRYYIPEGQKINVGGQELDAFALKPGMRINAKVTQEVPEEDVEVRRGEVVGMAPPEPTPAPAEPTTTAQSTAPTAPAQPAEESTPAADKNEALPQTASNLPLLGLIGALLMLLGYKTLYRRT